MADAPQVFISHASEDKQRFVLQFAEKLRTRGVRVWLDKWEMLPGDSLVKKIFEEGIGNAKAMIIIVSSNSVESPWVREELDVGMVRKINGVSKLIPVVVDDCRVPDCLLATVWERITNLNDYEANLDRIVLAVFGTSEKTAVGDAPKYVSGKSIAIIGLKEIDSTIFTALCNACIAKDNERIDGPELGKIADSLGLNHEVFGECLEILEGKGLVELRKIDSGEIYLARPMPGGFDKFLSGTRSNYLQLLRSVALLIVNEKKTGGADLAKCARQADPTATELVVNHCVRFFESKGWAEVHRYNGFTPCSFVIGRVRPEMARWLSETG